MKVQTTIKLLRGTAKGVLRQRTWFKPPAKIVLQALPSGAKVDLADLVRAIRITYPDTTSMVLTISSLDSSQTRALLAKK